MKALEYLMAIKDNTPKGHTYDSNLDEALKELEDLSAKDKLAELEQLLLDFFSKTHDKNKHGLCGWTFEIEIKSYYKIKVLKVYFIDNHSNIDKFFELKAETTKEMFDKTLEHFYSI